MAAAARVFPPQPLNFEDEAGILRDLPSSPPIRIHKLIIDVDDLAPKDFIRLNELYCHRSRIDEWILGVSNPRSSVGFELTRLFSLMKLFHPKSLMVQQSSQIVQSPAFSDFLKASPQLSLLVIDCSQDYQLSNLDLKFIRELRINIMQDSHVRSVSNLASSNSLMIPKLHLWISHGITTLASLKIPSSVTILSLGTQQVTYQQFQTLSLTVLRRHTGVKRLVIRWRGSHPPDLLGLHPVPTIKCLNVQIMQCLRPRGSADDDLDLVSSTLQPLLQRWNHVTELRLSPPRAATSAAVASRLSTKCDYLQLVRALCNTIRFPSLTILGLSVTGMSLQQELCDGLVELVRSLRTLNCFQLSAEFETPALKRVYASKFTFYCELHSFPEDLLKRTLPLSLWPPILQKAATSQPSIMFHFLQRKNDLLIPRRREEADDDDDDEKKQSGRNRKRARTMMSGAMFE